MLKRLYTVAFMMVTCLAFAQQSKECGTDIIEQELLKDPAYQLERNAFENSIQQLLGIWENGGMSPADPNPEDAVHEIPLVFHIIHKGEPVGTGTNISDAQILSAVDALNRDFRRTSADNGIALGAGVDTKIQFCLAQRDPNGYRHSGINRVNGTVVVDYKEFGILYVDPDPMYNNDFALKSLSFWDNRYYLNVWVVSEIEGNNTDRPNPNNWDGGVVGFAKFPKTITEQSVYDGVVVVNSVLGSDPTGSKGFRLMSDFNINRILAHEIGHFLGLYHTFQGESCSETNCKEEGDRICDTPPTDVNRICFAPSCNGAQVENYMDYTEEFCQNMFTAGQAQRMHAILQHSRFQLLQTENCEPGFTGRCDTLKNYTYKEVLEHYEMDNTWGYIPGHNGLGWTAYAEPFHVSIPKSIRRLKVDIATADYGSSASVVRWNVHEDDNGKPGAIIGSTTTPINSFTPGNTHSIDFPAPVPVDGHFWVSMDLTYNQGDLFTIHTAKFRGLNGINTTKIKTNGNWENLDDHFLGIPTTSLGIELQLSDGPGPQPSIEQSASVICEGNTVAFSGDSPTNTSSSLYQWKFQGGAPPFAFSKHATVTYNTPGIHNVTYYATAGCYIDSAMSTVTVTEDVTIDAINVVHANGGLNNGSITINASGGTSPYQYSIDNGANFYNSNIFSFLAPGTYEVVVKDANDCEAYSTAWIYQTSAANNGSMNMANGVNTTTAMQTSSTTALSDAIQLYPNPSNGMVHLNINLEQEQDVKITVLNAIGEVMQTMESKATTINTFTFDLSNEAKGIYFFNIQTNDNTITKRVTLAE